jgi:hypothetical protein
VKITQTCLAALATVALACATKPTPITVTGDSGDTVSGVLDAYRDPQCDCSVLTTFTGRVNGDTIDGMFLTRGSQTAAPQTGTWRVKRTAR